MCHGLMFAACMVLIYGSIVCLIFYLAEYYYISRIIITIIIIVVVIIIIIIYGHGISLLIFKTSPCV